MGVIGDRWGVTDAETRLSFACDDLVTRPAVQLWRGVTVAAPPERVWPWVTQIRVAPYSYDWIDNLGRRSPPRLLDLPPPQVGEPFITAATGPTGEVLAVEAGRQLTGRILSAVMSYLLQPVEAVDGAGGPPSTRLLLKIVLARGRWAGPLISCGDLVMARRQLLNLARLAEQDPMPDSTQQPTEDPGH